MHLLKKIKSILFFVVYTLIFLCALYACASIGTPEGGAYDAAPPVFVRSNPAPNSINFNKNKIELVFDEYISIEKPNETVIITPPQQKQPIIKALGKKISVELKDSLRLNTTYTFDFTNGIVDSNEKNAIEGFTFAFSTGDVVDTMVVSGLLLNASNLEPMPGIMVGLHSDLADSAFTSLPFERTSMTNDRGRFWIRNVAPGNYRLFALSDKNRNFKFDQSTEEIAFFDSIIVPDFEPAVRMDTIWQDSLTVDTILEVHYNRFTPDNAILYLFQEEVDNQYLAKIERPVDRQLIFHFNSNKALPPTLYLFKDDVTKDMRGDWYIMEYSPDRKDITYWITDSLLYQRDTIKVEADYMIDDSLFNLVSVTDTLKFAWRDREASKKKDKNEKDTIAFLAADFSAKGTVDIFDTVKITFSEPLRNLDLANIQFQQKVDTLWENREFSILQDTLNPRLYYINHKWDYGNEFKITIDSATIYSVYDKWNDSIATQFKFRTEDEYGDLYVKIIGRETNGFGELLDNSEKVVRKSPLYGEEIIFENLKPGKYYLRYIEDENENGKWDTGKYSENRQPEKVYYFEGVFDIRKYSTNEQNWNIKNIPIEKQKPLDITKNKPVAKKPKKGEEQNNNQQKNTNRTNTGNQSGSSPRINSGSTSTIQQSTR